VLLLLLLLGRGAHLLLLLPWLLLLWMLHLWLLLLLLWLHWALLWRPLPTRHENQPRLLLLLLWWLLLQHHLWLLLLLQRHLALWPRHHDCLSARWPTS
jgi:hypothetical protein